MRGHAKAKSAGTSSSVLFGRGAIGALAALALLFALALAPSTASARKIHVPSSFSPIDGSGIGVGFQLLSGIGVDEESGNVFVNNGYSRNVTDILGAEGGVPSGVASPYRIGGFAFGFEPNAVVVDNSPTSPSQGTLYVVDVENHKVKKFTLNAGSEEYEASGELTPTSGPAFSYPMGAAVDVEGNVFVADWGSVSVVKFGPTGTQLGRIGTQDAIFGGPSSVAVDSDGDLFAMATFGRIAKFPANASGEIFSSKFNLVYNSDASGLAVDSAANSLYIGENQSVSQYDATTLALQDRFGNLSEARGMTVNSETERLYVAEGGANDVAVFETVIVPGVESGEATAVTTVGATLNGTVNPDGVALEECTFEYGTTESYGQSAPCVAPNAAEVGTGGSPVLVHAGISGLAIGETYHFRLVAKNENGTAKGSDVTFRAPGPPEIHSQEAFAIRDTSAKLKAKVYPGRLDTTYRFEYVIESDFEASGYAKAKSAPPSDESIGSGVKDVEVIQSIGDLTPFSTYHFRTIATNALGTSVEGPGGTFKTHSARFDGLPDNRAYEQASPVDKSGMDARGMVELAKASIDGNAVSFGTTNGIPGGEGGQDLPTYLASRGADGWSTQGLLPNESAGADGEILGWTPDFVQVFSFANSEAEGGGSVLLSRSSADGALTVIASEVGAEPHEPHYAGASADGSRVVFEARVKLQGTNGVEGKSNVYIWDRDSGELSLASALNDETAPPAGAFAGSYDWIRPPEDIPAPLTTGGAVASHYTQDNHAIAADGSVYFTAALTGQLYLRLNPTEEQSALDGEGHCTEAARACTIHVSASQKTVPDKAGQQPAAFMAATPDGSKAFFTSPEKLTDDANTGPEPTTVAAIARADVDDGGSANLSFLPATAHDPAVDGTYIYWTNPKAGTIGRATLDGNGVDEEFITGAGKPQYVAVNDEYVYWTNSGDGENGHGTIGRAKIDGSGAPELNFITGANDPEGIAVDAEHIYWANNGSGFGFRGIGRANLDGTNPNQLIHSTGGEEPHGVALSATRVYWTTSFPNSSGYVLSVKLDTPAEAESYFFAGGRNLYGLAADDTYLYWSSQKTNEIGRAKLDYSDRASEFITDAEAPEGLAVDAEHIYWAAGQEIPPHPGNDLYQFDAEAPPGERLTDITPDSADENGAEVKGVLGTSEDGSYVYFAANGVLTNTPNGEGESALPGNCNGSVSVGFVNFTGTCNLYLAHEGSIAYVARLDAGAGAARNWLPLGLGRNTQKIARVSPDGRTILFRSPVGSEGLFRYRLGDSAPVCVTCDPTGAAPTNAWGFGEISHPEIAPRIPALVLSRVLSEDGDRVFFETTAALLAADSNGDEGCPYSGPGNRASLSCLDVYEWEANGSGTCHSEEINGGCLYLLSSGKSSDSSFLIDASASGDDVFIATRSSFVGQDKDGLFDVYDARVGGGLASQNQPPPPVPCEGEACKGGASTPPVSETPSTPNFVGPGNPKPVHKKKARKRKRHHRAKKRQQKHQQRNAKTTRRTSR